MCQHCPPANSPVKNGTDLHRAAARRRLISCPADSAPQPSHSGWALFLFGVRMCFASGSSQLVSQRPQEHRLGDDLIPLSGMLFPHTVLHILRSSHCSGLQPYPDNSRDDKWLIFVQWLLPRPWHFTHTPSHSVSSQPHKRNYYHSGFGKSQSQTGRPWRDGCPKS